MLTKEQRQIRSLLWNEYKAQVAWSIARDWNIQALGMFDSKELN